MQWLAIINLGASVVFMVYIYNLQKAMIINEFDGKLLAAATAIPFILPDNFHDRIFNSEDGLPEYTLAMKRLTEYARNNHLNYLYTFIKKSDGKFYTASTSLSDKDIVENKLDRDFFTDSDWKYDFDKEGSTIPKLGQYYEEIQEFHTAISTGKPVFSFNKDEFGSWRSCTIAYKYDGHNIFIAGADVDASNVFTVILRSFMISCLIAGAGFLVTMFVCYKFANRVTADLINLADNMDKASDLDIASMTLHESDIKELEILNLAAKKMRTNLKSFSKYVPFELVRKLIQSGQEAKLSGVHSEITIFFSDVEKFAEISEILTSEELVEALGEYLGKMSDIIIAENGTVDKYVGDMIMAFWGAPNPLPTPALNACRAALACRDLAIDLKAKFDRSDLPAFHSRFGIHSGPAVVGNIGCKQRMNYTAMGDNVNLASRLESLNKFYGTTILISESTNRMVRDHILTRAVDRVAVKGRREGTVIFEVICLRKSATPEMRELATLSDQILKHYTDGDWEKAIAVIDVAMSKFPNDKTLELIMHRCMHYKTNPPTGHWDGITRMDSK